MDDLTGACYLLTGATGGIGSATAEMLRGAGARVLTVDLAPVPGDPDSFGVDLTSPEGNEAAVAAAVGIRPAGRRDRQRRRAVCRRDRGLPDRGVGPPPGPDAVEPLPPRPPGLAQPEAELARTLRRRRLRPRPRRIPL